MTPDRPRTPHELPVLGQSAQRVEPFDWPEEQRAFYRVARELIEAEGLRRVVDPEPAQVRARLRMAGDLGLMVLHVPERLGGPGHGLGASLLATEASARSPAWSLTLGAVIDGVVDPLLLAGGDAFGPGALGAGLADPVTVGSCLVDEPLCARDTGDGAWSLEGTVVGMPHAASADLLLVRARLPGGEDVLARVDRGVGGVSLSEPELAAGVPLHVVRMHEVRAGADRVLRVPRGGLETLTHMRALRRSFTHLGAARALAGDAIRAARARSGGSLPREGGVRRRAVAMLVAIDLAEVLAYGAGAAVQRRLGASASQQEPSALSIALAAHAIDVARAAVAAWRALEVVLARAPALASALGGSAHLVCRDVVAQHDAALLRGGPDRESRMLAGASTLGAPDEVPVEGDLLRERRVAAAAIEAALSARAATSGASTATLEEVAPDLALLDVLAVGLRAVVDRALMSSQLTEVHAAQAGLLASHVAGAAPALARRVLESALDGPELLAASARLTALARYEPFDRQRAEATLAAFLEAHDGPPEPGR